MKGNVNKAVFFLLWIFLIHVTHSIVFSIADFLFVIPSWMSDLTFFIIAGIYVSILIRYGIRIEITIKGKQVFYFRNRGNY